ncbi:MAG TPA: hypothetical protein EYG92_09570 [Lutibacter sp.]|nr:hypothetical protein [Lutibacter sp.]
MFENIGKSTVKKKTHKDVSDEKSKNEVKKATQKPSKPFKEGSDGFVRSTISIPNDFGKFLHDEILYGGIKKKKLTEVIMNLLEEEYGKKFMDWREENG